MFFNKFIKLMFEWQPLVGALIGASAPFLLWWFTEIIRKKKARIEYVYSIYRLMADQINMVVDIKRTLRSFIEERLDKLISNVKSRQKDQYSAEVTFFPMFSVRSLPDAINTKSTGVSYIDNKISRAFSLSKDLAEMINDAKRQFEKSLDINEKIVFSEKNHPEVQKIQYSEQLEAYKSFLEEIVLKNNLNIYLKLLLENLVLTEKFLKIGRFRWNIKYNPNYSFYLNTKRLKLDKENLFLKLEEEFREEVEDRLSKLD